MARDIEIHETIYGSNNWEMFTRFGVPDSISCDGATQFTAKRIKVFCQMFVVDTYKLLLTTLEETVKQNGSWIPSRGFQKIQRWIHGGSIARVFTNLSTYTK